MNQIEIILFVAAFGMKRACQERNEAATNGHLVYLVKALSEALLPEEQQQQVQEILALRKTCVQKEPSMVTDEQVLEAVRTDFLGYLAQGDGTYEIKEVRIESRNEQKGEIEVRVVWTFQGADELPPPDDALYTVSIEDHAIVDVWGPQW